MKKYGYVPLAENWKLATEGVAGKTCEIVILFEGIGRSLIRANCGEIQFVSVR
jgi:hypothetical protein